MPRKPKRLSAFEIADDIADRIASGEYPPGSRLPRYLDLSNLYGVGATTISVVIALLKDRGLVEGEQGKGVFVAEPEEPHQD